MDPVYKHKLIDYITNFLTEKRQETTQVNTWSTDVIEKLLPFITEGKMIRGSLVLFIYEAYNQKLTDDAVKAAVAIELFHSSLLIHDDIMDNDTNRRGQQTVFAKYQTLGKQKNFAHTHHFGESMGICVGDIGFFLAFQLLSSIKNDQTRQSIIDVCMKEMVNVGLAQMQDVYAGYSKDTVTEADIEKVYIYKTGRYTFSLPMMLGALLAHQNKETIQTLEQLGEKLGFIFQLKDDELSLFGNQDITGKPEGSDIRENKKTLYRFYLFEKASPDQRRKLAKIFGRGIVIPDELLYIRSLIKNLGIQEIIDKRIQNLHHRAKKIIMTLDLHQNYKQQLLALLIYISERNN